MSLWTFSGRDLRLSDWNCLFWHEATAWNGQTWKQQQRKRKWGKMVGKYNVLSCRQDIFGCDSISKNLTPSVRDRFLPIFKHCKISTLNIAVYIYRIPILPNLAQLISNSSAVSIFCSFCGNFHNSGWSANRGILCCFYRKCCGGGDSQPWLLCFNYHIIILKRNIFGF